MAITSPEHPQQRANTPTLPTPDQYRPVDEHEHKPRKSNKKRAFTIGGAAAGLAGLITTGVVLSQGSGKSPESSPNQPGTTTSAPATESLSPEQQERAAMQAQEAEDIALAETESVMSHEQLVDRFEISAAEFPTVQDFTAEFMSRLDHWINAGGTTVEAPVFGSAEERQAYVEQVGGKYDAAMIEALYGPHASEGNNPAVIESITEDYHANVLSNVAKVEPSSTLMFRGTLEHEIVTATQEGSTAYVELNIHYTDNGDENNIGRIRVDQGQPRVYDVQWETMGLQAEIDAEGNWKVVSFESLT